MEGFISSMKRSPISHLMLGITFFVSGLIINLVQAFLYFGIRPFSKYVHRKLNYYLGYSLYCQTVFLAEWWADIDVTFYIDRNDFVKYFGKEHGFLIGNHSYEIDWLLSWILCDRVEILGNAKPYVKKSIQYVPTIGWAWKFGESIFLERNWEKDKEIMGRQIRELVEYPDPMWVALMAEGTRFTPEKHEASKVFARKKGLPILQHHLNPRTKGFTTSIPFFRGKDGAIYNLQFAFKKSGTSPTMTNVLLGQKIEASIFMERIDLDQVPKEEEACAQWMHDLFQKKDRMMDSFYRTGDFFTESNVRRVDGFHLPRRYYSLINTITWAFLVITPISYYLLCLFTSGSTVDFGIGVTIISIFFVLLSKMIGMTKISEASSYGRKATTETKHSPSATEKTD